MTRKRRLSEEDLAAWRAVARTVHRTGPLQKAQIQPSPPAHPAPSAKPGPSAPVSIPPFRIGAQPRYDHSKGHDLTPTLETRLAGQALRMDRKTFRSMKRGKLKPDRRIDLHGMTLDEAHRRLSRFVIRSQADGCRLVLVITGKGRTGRDDGGPIPTPRGVLRNHVPQWLRLAPLGQLVLQVTDAHASHGGSGAFYVYLARRR